MKIFIKKKKNLTDEEKKKLIKGIPNELIKRLKDSEETFKQTEVFLNLINKKWFYSYSLSSVSMQAFYKNYNNFDIEIKFTREMDKKIRSAFYGGRCEVFGNPNNKLETVYHYDFKNMYGNLMLEKFPTGELILNEYIYDFKKKGFYYITVSSEEMKIPVLPHRTDINKEESVWEEHWEKEMIFSNGVFSGLYYSEEIELFINEGGKILKIHYAYVYEKEEKAIFRAFMQKLINLRNETNHKIWKMLIVSFYGRMGMSPKNTENIIGNSETYQETMKNAKIIQEIWFGDVYIAEIEKQQEDEIQSNVGYAAIITAKARVKLFKNIKKIEENGGRVLYCDTDSIFAAFSKKKKIINTTMGDIKWEKDLKNLILSDAVFAGTRSYSIKTKENWETKISGLPRNSIEFEEFKKNFYSSWIKDYEIKVIGSRLFKTENWNYLINTNLNKYKKRIFSEDKKNTKPLLTDKGNYYEDPKTKWY